MTVINPIGITYFSSDITGTPVLYVVFFYTLQPNQTYKLQYTSDGVTWFDVGTVTGGPSARTYSVTVNTQTGPWPRLVTA